MTLKPINCFVIVCDGCGETETDDDMDGTPHFDSPDQVTKYLGGWVDGKLYEGWGSGTVALPDGTHLCWSCKTKPHPFVAGEPIPDLCARCGELPDVHDGPVELPAPFVPGQADLLVFQPAEERP